MPWNAIGGFDYYLSSIDSDRSHVSRRGADQPLRPVQCSVGMRIGSKRSRSCRPPTPSAGASSETNLHARDTFDANAPGAVAISFGFPVDTQGIPLDRKEVNRAYHLGAEHRFTQNFAVFGRMAQSFRVPNVDERVGMATPQGGRSHHLQSANAEVARSMKAAFASTVGPFDMQMEHL